MFVMLLFFFLGFQTYRNPPLDTFHEGETLGMAIDYESGKKPYAETIFLHGVFQDPLRSVLAFKIFGASIASARTMSSILNVLAFVLFFLTLFLLFDFRIAASVFSGTLLLMMLYVYYSVISRDINAYLGIIPVLLFSKRYISSRSVALSEKNVPATFFALAFFAAFFPVASFAYSIDRGFYSSFGYLVFLVLGTVIFFRNKKILPHFLVASLLGIVSGIAVIAIAVRGALADFLAFTFRDMPSYKELMDGFVYQFRGESLVPVAVFSVILFWLGKRFVATIMAEKNAGLWQKAGNFVIEYFLEIFLLGLSLAYYRSALGRGDIGHIIDATGPLLILSVYIIVKRIIGYRESESRQFFAVTCVVLAAASMLVFSKFDISQKNANWWRFPLHTKDAELIPENHKKTILFLKENLNDNQYFVTLTSEGVWYYYLNKPCPIKFPIVWFASPSFYQKEIISEMRAKKDIIKYVIYKNGTWTNNFDFIPNEKRLSIVFDYVRQNYQFYTRIDDQEIWKVKTD